MILGFEIENKKIISISGLVEVIGLDDSFIIDIKYASDNNFVGKQLYCVEKFILQINTAKKLIAANNEFKKFGYRLKIFDGYRPLSVQKIMWDLVHNEDFIAPPSRGSVHNRGAAVDVTLIDENGNEVEMPSGFDDFSEKAGIYFASTSQNAIKNREFLAEIMEKNGFNRIESEWWHFADSDFIKYPLLDISFEEF